MRKFVLSCVSINVKPLTAHPFLTKRELAKHLGVSVRGVEGFMAARKIPYYTLGHRTVRFDLEKVMVALGSFEVKAH